MYIEVAEDKHQDGILQKSGDDAIWMRFPLWEHQGAVTMNLAPHLLNF